ncbi:very long-chain-fatty-acid--CoA ligase bubblegum-like [Mercenaria mercenaria]|uniref:very long-chain-fatty-acid--CoA ligase bubblegum-like n=1 Tax=Mercenaria mercenaria TaxID=6596 RepID=UPI00234F2B0B|nr:very long-chain-fatty-acid--CoA ligase bubblegum-like [Mercenaria mercenaria]
MEERLTESYIKVTAEEYESLQFLTIVDSLKLYANINGESEAVVFVSTDGTRQSVTWSELYEKSRKAAQAFVHLGLKEHEVAALNIRNCPEWLYASFGAMMAGAIPISISFTYTDTSDLIALMEKLQTCSLLVMDPGLDNINWNILRQVIDECNASGRVTSEKMPFLRYLVGVSFDQVGAKLLKFSDLLNENHSDIDLPKVGPKDISLLFQTSGSTGIPKVVAHTHEPYVKGVTGKHIDVMDAKYKLFNDRPFAWSGGFPFSVLTGQTRVTVSGFCEHPEDRVRFMTETIERERCTSVFALPPLMHELIKRQNELPPDWPVIIILCSGQPLTKKLASCIGKSCNCCWLKLVLAEHKN